MIRKTDRADDDFAEEVRAHIELEADQLIAEGMAPDQAMGTARRAFGNVTRTRERFYESNRRLWLDHLLRDTHRAFRQMRLAPVSTAIILASLALGIGLNTAIFSLADQALIRTLPVRAPEELVQLDWNGEFVGTGRGSVGHGSLLPFPLYKELKADNQTFVDMFARTSGEVHLRAVDRSEVVDAEIVTGSYFSTLGIRPALGRLIGPADDQAAGAHPLAVLSYDHWQRRFGGDPSVLGTQVRMNGHPMMIVGVAQAGFRGTDWSTPASLWVPMTMMAQATDGWSGLELRRSRFSHVFARLKPGVTREGAAAALQPWFRNYLVADTEHESWPAVTESRKAAFLASELDLLSGARGQSALRAAIQQPMLILLCATALVFLLACLNVANLSLARALAGRRATALRSALGASRWRIVAERMIDCGVLAATGCALGAALVPFVSRGALAFLTQQGTGRLAIETGLDVRVLLFAVSVAALSILISGAAPAFYAASVQPVVALKAQASGNPVGLGVRKVLVVGQFALALILLVGAGLFVRSLGSLRAQGPGFSTTNLLMFNIRPENDGIPLREVKPLVRDLMTSLRDLPETEQVGVASLEILSGGGMNLEVTVEASERIVTESISMNTVSRGFFESLGTPVFAGRDFDRRDAFDGSGWNQRSAIVNQAFVERYLGDTEPIGVRFGLGDGTDVVPDIEIIGVVPTFRDRDFRVDRPLIFFSLWEAFMGKGTFHVRTRTPSHLAARSIRATVERIAPTLTVLSMRTLDDQLDRKLSNERMLAALATGFAVVALLLAAIGLYGVLSFSAELRTKEIGIRLALGAKPWSAGSLIVREALMLTGAGLAIAFPVAYALGRLVENQLFGVRPADLPTFTAAGFSLTLVCLVASLQPARQAWSTDPLESLRRE